MEQVSQTVKLTSKHQLTLPAKVVRELRLAVGDVLLYEVRDGTIVLKRRPSLSQHLGPLWTENARTNKGVASDASIKQTLKKYHRQRG